MSIRTARNGQPTGVWELSALQAAVDRSEVLPTDLVWTKGFRDWTDLSEVAGEIGISLPESEEAVPPIPGSSKRMPPPIPRSPPNPVSSQIPTDIQGASDLRFQTPGELASKQTKGLDPGIKVLLYAIVGLFLGAWLLAQINPSALADITNKAGSLASKSSVDPASAAAQIVKKSVRSPSTFQYVRGEVLWTGRSKESDPAYVVKVIYDAQNGFGAMIRGCALVAFAQKSDGSAVWSTGHGVNFDSCEDTASMAVLEIEKQYVEGVIRVNDFTSK